MSATMPFPVPAKLPVGLGQVRKYWQDLRRRENSMPFWDDVKLSELSAVTDRLLLIDVFEKPQRFRFNTVGKLVRDRYGNDLLHRFSDELEIRAPFEFCASQSSATVEGSVPTFYRNAARTTWYSRILLPMWGNGRIEMLLGAIAFPKGR